MTTLNKIIKDITRDTRELELSDRWSSTLEGQGFVRTGLFEGKVSTAIVTRSGWEGWRAQVGYNLVQGDPDFVAKGNNHRVKELCAPGEYLSFGEACRRVDTILVNQKGLDVCKEVTDS